MERLIDANVVLRVLLCDSKHPRYNDATELLRVGGRLRDYVVPEIIFNFCGTSKVRYAASYAKEHGAVSDFHLDPRGFARKVEYPAGFRKRVYGQFLSCMRRLLQEYPNVTIDQKDLFDVALGVACETGHDWVDCMLEAERQFGWVEVASLDKDLHPGAPQSDATLDSPGSKQASKLTLPK